MDKIFEIVRKLEEIRKKPQFIFIDSIYPIPTLKVREKVLLFIKENPKADEIDFILESSGGLADDAYRIIRTLRKNFKKGVNIVIPFWAKSAATLLALGGSTIIMDEFGEFGPLDTQLRDEELPAAERKSALIDEYALKTIEDRFRNLYKSMMIDILEDQELRIKKSELSNQLLSHLPRLFSPLLDKIDTYEIGEKARALAVGENYIKRILLEFNKENVAEPMGLDFFVDYIVHGCPDHSYIIDYSVISNFLNNVIEAREIGKDYCETLTELSMLFFNDSVKDKYIGFCPKEETKTQDKIQKEGESKNE